MKKIVFLNALLLFLTARVSLAQETFNIQNASKKYDLKVQVEECGGQAQNNMPNVCGGAAQVRLYRKGITTPFQKINLKNIEVDKEQTAYNPAIDKRPRKIYDDEYSFIFGDFNFDGDEDLAICNGRNGGYGAPSYNVYLYEKGANVFIENKRLSKLTEGVYLGLFFVAPKKKQLIAYSKSGCCYHETEVYQMVGNKPVLIEKEIEEAGDKYAVITTKRLVNGKWVKKVRREKIRENTS